jgi:HD-GYP domain-containing protein (c-di-GMP phosphodiesterase class II)
VNVVTRSVSHADKNTRKPPLQPLLKARVLKQLLTRAVAVAPSGTMLRVVSDGIEMACVGAGMDVPVAWLPDPFPLHIDGMTKGCLELGHAGPPATAPAMEQALSLARFTAAALQEIIDRTFALRAVSAETIEQYRETALVHRAVIHLNRSLELHDVSHALLRESQRAVPVCTQGMVLSDVTSAEGMTAIDTFGAVTETGLRRLEKNPLLWAILDRGNGEIRNELGKDAYWTTILPNIHALLVIPLRSARHWSGALVLASDHPDAMFRAADLKQAQTLSMVATAAMANACHFAEERRMMEAILQALATAIDARDPTTSGHSQRVARYAQNLARAIDQDDAVFPDIHFSEADLREIHFAGLLHDVGKIGVPEVILSKRERLPPDRLERIGLRLALWGERTDQPWREHFERICHINTQARISPDDIEFIETLAIQRMPTRIFSKTLLTEEERAWLSNSRGTLTLTEWRTIQRHVTESFRILSPIPFPENLARVATIARQHHEKLDGSGYPDGLHAPDILIQSQIVAVADIFDALVDSDRPYKDGLSLERAFSILTDEATIGRLNAAVVTVFKREIGTILPESPS